MQSVTFIEFSIVCISRYAYIQSKNLVIHHMVNLSILDSVFLHSLKQKTKVDMIKLNGNILSNFLLRATAIVMAKDVKNK